MGVQIWTPILFMKKHLFIWILALLVCPAVSAQFKFKQDSVKKQSFIALPYGGYSAETNWMGGLATRYYFWNQGELNRVSTLAFDATYSLNNQISLGLYSRYYFNDEYYLYGRLLIEKFPDYFFGLGNQTLEENKEYYIPVRYHLILEPQKFVTDKLMLGLSIHSRYEKILEYDEGQLQDQIIAGSEPYSLQGLGGIIAIDSRDNNNFPTRGMYFKTAITWFMPVLGSTYNYVDIKSDFRYFLPVFKKAVLGNQTIVQYQTASAPFQMTPTFGGLDHLRGYRGGRYRDRLFMMEQIELRFPVYKRISAATYAAVGNVWEDFNKISTRDIKFAFGAGVRFRINDAGVNLRADGALNKDLEPAYYLTGSEAF